MNTKLSRVKELFIIFAILLSYAYTLPACSDKEEDEDMLWLQLGDPSVNFPSIGGTRRVYLVVADNVDMNGFKYEIPADAEWCSVDRVDRNLMITADRSFVEEARATIVTIRHGDKKRELAVTQEASTGSINVKLKVIGASATSEEVVQEQRGIDKSFDNDYASFFNSKFGAITQWPFQMEYKLEIASRLDYIVYYPRTDSGNKWGAFNEFKVLVATEDDPNNFKVIGEYSRGDGVLTPFKMAFDDPTEKVIKVRFDIYSAFQSRVSCSEMEFYQINSSRFDYSTIFSDELCTQLKPGITEEEIQKIPEAEYKQMALASLHGNYKTEFRVGKFRPYQDPKIMAGINKTSPYSMRDNPTGIYVNEGDELVVMTGALKGQEVSLIVQDLSIGFGSSISYILNKGNNRIKIRNAGLVYVQNYTKDKIPLILETDADKAAAEAKSVEMHFVMSKVNGYFDSQKHNAGDWTRILNEAKYQDIDALGKRAHITWKTDDFRSNKTDIVSVLNKYDQLVYLQQEFMGLEKYEGEGLDRRFKNRMYFHIDYKGKSPYASANRTAYTPGYAELFCKADRFEARLWGAAHEVGHCNQTRPGLKWAGTTEVTNNIHSMYVQQQFGQRSKLLADGTYAQATTTIIDAQQPHCLQNASNQFMMKLVPFWQLKLYMIDAGHCPDFYKDLYEYYRITNLSAKTEGELQLEFVRQACRISGINLLDFFDKWGFLRAVNIDLNDYGTKNLTVTDAQITSIKNEINGKGYITPSVEIHKITEDNVDSYK